MKNRPVGVELFHADGRTDRHGAVNGRFSKFCERAYKLERGIKKKRSDWEKSSKEAN